MKNLAIITCQRQNKFGHRPALVAFMRLLALSGATIHAHSVENPAVQKRMDVMKEIKGLPWVFWG